MFSLVVWTFIGGALVLFLLVLDGYFDPKTILLWPTIVGIGVLFGDVIAAFALIIFIMVFIVWFIVGPSLQQNAERYHNYQMDTNPYYNPDTKRIGFWTKREEKLTPGIAMAILKISYSDIPMRYGFNKKELDDIFVSYVLDKELITPKIIGCPIDYLRNLEASNPYDNIVRFLDLHCLKKGVKFREWGCLDNEIVFPLSEHVRKYKSELDRMGVKVNTDHSGYQKRPRLPQRYQFRENAEKAQKKSKR